MMSKIKMCPSPAPQVCLALCICSLVLISQEHISLPSCVTTCFRLSSIWGQQDISFFHLDNWRQQTKCFAGVNFKADLDLNKWGLNGFVPEARWAWNLEPRLENPKTRTNTGVFAQGSLRLQGLTADLLDQGRQACGQESGTKCQIQWQRENGSGRGGEIARRRFRYRTELGTRKRSKERMQRECAFCGLSLLWCLTSVLWGQVDGSKELIRRCQPNISQDSAAQPYMLLQYWNMSYWL